MKLTTFLASLPCVKLPIVAYHVVRAYLARQKPENLLLFFTIIAVVTGTIIGIGLNPLCLGRELSERESYYLGFFGSWFLRVLKLLIIPMVISSNISSIASLNNVAATWLVLISLSYYMATSIIAVTVGIIVVLLIRPGHLNLTPVYGNQNEGKGFIKLMDSLLYTIRDFFPENIFAATSKIERDILNITGNAGENMEALSKTNILGPIVVSIMFGVAIRNLDGEAVILADFFHSLRRTMVYLVSIIMWVSPFGILSLIAQNIAMEKDFLNALRTLFYYVLTVMVGLMVHAVVILPILLRLITKRNPLKFTANMLQALICACGTASSTATLPCTVKCLEKEESIDYRVSRFMLPLGTTINMDGTIMYEAIAVIYIAQRMDITLSIEDIFLVGFTSVLAGMAAASMPSAGILTMTMVLTTIGIHPSKTTLIIPIDWFLDRFRTMTNVYGDAIGTAIVSRLSWTKLHTKEGEAQMPDMPDPQNFIMELTGGLTDIDMVKYAEKVGGPPMRHISCNPLKQGADEFSGEFEETDLDTEEDEIPFSCLYIIDDDSILVRC